MMCDVKATSWQGVGVAQQLNIAQPVNVLQHANVQPQSSGHGWPAEAPHVIEFPAAAAGPGAAAPADDSLTLLVHNLEELRRNAINLQERLKQVEQMDNTLLQQCQESQKRMQQLQQMQGSPSVHPDVFHRAQVDSKRIEDILKDRNREVHQSKVNLVDTIRGHVQQLSYVEHVVLEKHISNWHRFQQVSGTGQGCQKRLEQIQEVCEGLADLLWQSLELVQRFHFILTKITGNTSPGLVETSTLLESQLKTLLALFISGTFIIDKQPPQVMKTNTRFSTSLRMLIGSRLNIYMTPPQVTASIISESQAHKLAQSDGYPTTEVAGEIQNHVGSMEFNSAAKNLSCTFRNMSLKKIKRAEKKGTESVMDEKFCLVYQSIVKVGNLTFAIRTQSLPVVVIVHGNQEPHAWATVTWDNAFAPAQRIPFMVPDAVTWREMAHVLSNKFRWSTGRGLSEGNLQVLASKALRLPNLPLDYENRLISWTQFCKEPLPERTFTFWEWFYAVMKVTREHLRPLWTDGTIWGFVGRREAENSLLKRPHGTFLLRFSDSEPGGVTIGWVSEIDGHKDVLMVQPFTARDFQIRSLADRVSDLETLMFLYPHTPRDQAFGKYYTQNGAGDSDQANPGYVKPMLIFQLYGGRPPPILVDSNPSTPQSYYSQSESGIYPPSHDGGFSDATMQMYALSQGAVKRRRDPNAPQSNWPNGGE